ncbi:MAG: response regulator, partial [Anaerolineae bacterium]|nr:response regulator [Anaerolineae bacterium]
MPQSKILVVEDESITAQCICNALKAQGYEVCGPISSGEQAVQLVAETRPDLILMDVQLKGALDGIQAAREIRRHGEIPIVLITAHTDQDTLHRAQDIDPFGYILKPFDKQELVLTVAATLSRHRTTSELVQRERFLALLNDITRAALGTPDLQIMLQTLADRLSEVIHADNCYITLWDEQAQAIVLGAASDEWRERYATIRSHPGEPTLTESILRAGHSLVIEDVLNTPYVSRRLAEMFPVCSELGLPLIADGQKLGAAMIAFKTQHHFTPDEIAHCEQAANHVALALSKVRSLEAERTARRHSEALYHVAKAINSFDDLKHQLQTLTMRMAEALPADSVRLITFDLEKQQIVYDIQGGTLSWESPNIPFDELMDGLTGWVTCHQEPALSTKAMIPDPRESARVNQRRVDGDCGAIIVVPLLDQGRVLGTLTACNHMPQRDFTHQDMELMQAMANQAVIAIENASLGETIKHRLGEAETLARLTASLTQSLDLDQVL